MWSTKPVKKFDIVDRYMLHDSAEDNRFFCHTMKQVFRVNTSLESFRLPIQEINAENGSMTAVVAGLSCNNTITTIDFSSCDLDEAALSCLEPALVASPSMLSSISSIQLPRIRSQEGFKSFLRNLASMTCIKEVAIRDSLDAEGKELLLVAVKKKKTLRAFEWTNGNDPADAEIRFYLRLNRFDRQVVECSTVPASCWPMLLSRMTTNNQDAVALFYFIREYFANHQHADPMMMPQQQREQWPVEQHNHKRTRLE